MSFCNQNQFWSGTKNLVIAVNKAIDAMMTTRGNTSKNASQSAPGKIFKCTLKKDHNLDGDVIFIGT